MQKLYSEDNEGLVLEFGSNESRVHDDSSKLVDTNGLVNDYDAMLLEIQQVDGSVDERGLVMKYGSKESQVHDDSSKLEDIRGLVNDYGQYLYKP